MAFWENVETLRKNQNTTYRWLAQKTGISETTISTMRKNHTEPRASDAVKIARALETTVDFLVDGTIDGYYKKYSDLKSALRTVMLTF